MSTFPFIIKSFIHVILKHTNKIQIQTPFKRTPAFLLNTGRYDAGYIHTQADMIWVLGIFIYSILGMHTVHKSQKHPHPHTHCIKTHAHTHTSP